MGIDNLVNTLLRKPKGRLKQSGQSRYKGNIERKIQNKNKTDKTQHQKNLTKTLAVKINT